MKKDQRKYFIKKLKEKGIKRDYKTVSDHVLNTLYYVYIVQPRIEKDMNRGR